MIRRLLRLAYLIAQHPFHLHRWLVQRGLYQGWIKDFAPFWDTIRPPGLPITDYASYTFMEYVATGEFRARFPEGDHFDDPAAQVARLLSYVKRREMHPLRCLKQAWVLRHCNEVLEFGAGAAPYAYFVRRAWPWRQSIIGYDVPSLLARFAGSATGEWRQYQWDAIVCTEVFEHLDDPFNTAKAMIAAAPLICFDYVDDGTLERKFTLEALAACGTLTGPDARGLYVWREQRTVEMIPEYPYNPCPATAYYSIKVDQ